MSVPQPPDFSRRPAPAPPASAAPPDVPPPEWPAPAPAGEHLQEPAADPARLAGPLSVSTGAPPGTTPPQPAGPPEGRAAPAQPAGSQRSPGARLRSGLALVLAGAAGFILGIAALAGVQVAIQARLGDPGIPGDAVDASPDLILTLTPGLLTAMVRQSIDSSITPIPLKDPRVQTRNDRIYVLGRVDVLGRGVDGTVEMRPVVEEGQVRLKLVAAKLGPLPVPGNIERLAEAPINARVAAAVAGYPATVTGVRTTPDGVIVTAQVRPEDFRRPPTPAAAP